ncbi:MAG: aspartyl-tRNA(Asn)/glutamyl-tRNA(Gln) amidotransferase subunit [Hyphomicrobiales bacterium]|nr:aspartyl-tRNA(Asn)/glutamyl-tRNA(Gln) amidotransferase subunit [Hyphomicrobiales bacterium]
MSDIAEMNLKDLAAAIKRRKISSVEVVKALLARIDKWQPKLNAFARVEPDDALKSAKAADRTLAAGKSKGPLHGVPLAHKDMYYSKGKLAECGSKIRKGWVAPMTATAVQRLEAAGSFRLGAVNMVEFAFGPTGHNVHTGHVRNPWDVTRITGGSSSGSGSAVGARLIPAALGSDTGGSIRMPAHFCGVTGFKPTNNRVSRANCMPLSFSLDTVGPLAQTVDDCALILSVIAGPDPLDPTTAGAPKWNAKAARRAPKGMTIGIPKAFYVEDLETDVAKALDDAITAFKKLGVKVVQVDLPDQTLVSAAALIVLGSEAAAYHAPWLRTRPDDYGAQVRNRLQIGLAYSSLDYLEAMRWRGHALAAQLEAMGKCDAVLAPVSRAVAPTIEETDIGAGTNAEPIIQGITRFMRPINYLGLPALSLPAGFGQHGMPIGLQLIGRPFGDETCAALGSAFQAATDHHKKAPSLA